MGVLHIFFIYNFSVSPLLGLDFEATRRQYLLSLSLRSKLICDEETFDFDIH